MAKKAKVPVSGSDRAPVAGASRIGDADPQQRVSVTVVLRPRRGGSAAAKAKPGEHLTSAQLAEQRGADPADVERVRAFAAAHGLKVDEVNAAARSVSLSGNVAQVNAAFDVKLSRFADAQGSYRGRTGAVYVPADLAKAVEAVLGLDDRPQARAMFRIQHQPEIGPLQPHAAGTSFSPADLAKIYDFPTDVDGRGQTVAIIELGGGYKSADLTRLLQGPWHPEAVGHRGVGGRGEEHA